MRSLVGCLACLAVLGGTVELHAQIRGVVLDELTSRPVDRANVRLLDAQGALVAAVVSDAEGRFELEVGAGTYGFQILRDGYHEVTTPTFDLPEGAGPVDLTLLMPPDAAAPAAAPSGPLATFQRRMNSLEGTFLTPEEIEAKGGSRFTDVMRNVAGVSVVQMPERRGNEQAPGERRIGVQERYYTVRLAGSHFQRGDAGARQELEEDHDCPPVLFVDGRWWGSIDEQGSSGPDYEFLPKEIAAIEIYGRTEVPEELNTGSDALCGVIVIWRKPKE